MIIKIDGIGATNKGAQLMLFSVVDRMKKYDPSAEFILSSYSFNKLNQVVKDYDRVFLSRSLAARVKMKMMKMLGLKQRDLMLKALPKKIDVALDAGGYQFGDSWNHSEEDIAWIRRYYSALKERGAKIIMLPQAFGPFEKETSRKMISTAAGFADLIFPRDPESLAHLQQIFGTVKHFDIYGDFTNLLSYAKNDTPKGDDKICFILNQKMIAGAADISEQEYISFFVRMISHVRSKSENEIVLLNHEGAGDLALCNKVNAHFDGALHVITGQNALQIKEFLSGCLFVVSSRYHGIISALSQQVPCLATSWSHKYEELYREFELPHFVLDLARPENANHLIEGLLDVKENERIREALKGKNNIFANRTEEMWQKVFTVIEK